MALPAMSMSLHNNDAAVALAAILVRGVLRLRQAERAVSPESGVIGLALCSKIRPCGVDGSESRGKEQEQC